MGIDARLENERGDVVREVTDPRGHVNWLLGTISAEETSCLRFVDPYGQTVFNRGQMNTLRHELEALRSRITEQIVRDAKDDYLRSASGWPETARTEAGEYVASLSTNDLIDHVDKLLTLASDALACGPHHCIRFLGD